MLVPLSLGFVSSAVRSPQQLGEKRPVCTFARATFGIAHATAVVLVQQWTERQMFGRALRNRFFERRRYCLSTPTHSRVDMDMAELRMDGKRGESAEIIRISLKWMCVRVPLRAHVCARSLHSRRSLLSTCWLPQASYSLCFVKHLLQNWCRLGINGVVYYQTTVATDVSNAEGEEFSAIISEAGRVNATANPPVHRLHKQEEAGGYESEAPPQMALPSPICPCTQPQRDRLPGRP